MSGDGYERLKSLLCELVDLEREHGLKPGTLVGLMVLEDTVSYLALMLGEGVFEDWLKVLEKHGFYVDRRVRDALDRFPEVRKEVKERLRRFLGEGE